MLLFIQVYTKSFSGALCGVLLAALHLFQYCSMTLQEENNLNIFDNRKKCWGQWFCGKPTPLGTFNLLGPGEVPIMS